MPTPNIDITAIKAIVNEEWNNGVFTPYQDKTEETLNLIAEVINTSAGVNIKSANPVNVLSILTDESLTGNRSLTLRLNDVNRTLIFSGDLIVGDSGASVSNINTGDQISIVGITGTKAQFNTAVTDGNFLFDTVNTITEVEIDLGSTPIAQGSINVVDATIATSSKIIGGVAYKAPTGKDLDELEMDSFDLKFEPLSGSMNVKLTGLDGYIADKFIIWYLITT